MMSGRTSGYEGDGGDSSSSGGSEVTVTVQPVENVTGKTDYKEMSESEESSGVSECSRNSEGSDSSDYMERVDVKKNEIDMSSEDIVSCGGSFGNGGEITAPVPPVSLSVPSSSNETGLSGNESESPETPAEAQWEIEEIRDYVKDDFGEKYFVKWKDWSEDTNTWEPWSNIFNCEDELYRFYQLRKGMRKTALEKSEYVMLPNGKQRRLGPPLPPVPPDPRPFEVRAQEFFDLTGSMSEEDILDVYSQWKSKAVTAESRWPQAKIDKCIEQATDGLLSSDELDALKRQIVILKVEEKEKDLKIEIKEWERKINGITCGRPCITVENKVDLAGPPKGFEFVNDYVAGEGVEIPRDPPVGCQCEGTSCYDERNTKCCAVQSNCKFAYTRFGKVNVLLGSPIYECNSKCACGPDCPNRVVQDGKSDHKFSIFRTSDGRGWGVKTLKSIKKGSFVTLYAGEVIKSEEAERRGQIYDANGQTYLFDLDFNDSENCPFSVDASSCGNVSHFINHSCSPNLGVYSVWVDCLDPNLPKLAMFALKDISRDEELTFDYDVKLSRSRSDHNQEESQGDIRRMKTPCLCGTDKCRKFIFSN